jgi:hypothetical protein
LNVHLLVFRWQGFHLIADELAGGDGGVKITAGTDGKRQAPDFLPVDRADFP